MELPSFLADTIKPHTLQATKPDPEFFVIFRINDAFFKSDTLLLPKDISRNTPSVTLIDPNWLQVVDNVTPQVNKAE